MNTDSYQTNEYGSLLVFQKYLGEGSYGLIYLNAKGEYEVWETPQYGGEEVYCGTFTADKYDDAVRYVNNSLT